MNKKILIPLVAIIVIVIAIIIGVLIPKNEVDNNIDNINSNSSTVDTQLDEEIKNKAEEISKDIPGFDTENVEDILKEETTDQQNYTFNEEILRIKLDESATFDDDGKLHITDGEGNDTIIEDHPHQDVLDMTDEEAEEDFDKIMEQLNGYVDKAVQDSQNKEQENNQSNNSNTDNNTQNNSNNQTVEHTGEVWDQEFYDSLTGEADRKQYREASDANRIMMKAVMEKAMAEGTLNNNQSGEGPSAEDYMSSWGNVGN